MRLSDGAKTARIAAVLAERYPPPRFAPMWECAPGTGWASGFADLLVLHLWPSDGLQLHGFEIKASRTDLKRELADPEKWRKLGRYCDQWTLATYDTAVVGTLDLPTDWGWVSLDLEGGLDTHRKAPKLAPDPWPRQFAAAMLRRAVDQSPNAAFVGEAVRRALEEQSGVYTSQRKRDIEHAFRDAWYAARGLTYNAWAYTPEDRAAADEYRTAWQAWQTPRNGWVA